MLKQALNMLTKLHSRDGQLKRPGSPDIYSPCRLTPSSYFRFLRGPDSTTIHGREFIIPIDSMLGQFAQTVTFSATPTVGTFKLSYNGNLTSALAFNASASDVQIALRLLAGLSNVVVTGSVASGFIVSFAGFSTEPLILVAAQFASTLVTLSIAKTYATWSPRLKRADKVIDSVFGIMAIDEIVEMVDVGGAVMAFRIRCE